MNPKRSIRRSLPVRLLNPLFDLKKFIRSLIAYPSFIKDYIIFKRRSRGESPVIKIHPYLSDKTGKTPFDAHYIYHPAWAARILQKINPETHIDVSSLLGFSTILSAFIPVRFFDYRPAELSLSNLTSDKINLTRLGFPDNSIESLSCMHTVEHIGLGRYGDKIDPEGDRKAMAELKRVIKPGGHLLFVVPLGRDMILFNSQRIYSYEKITGYFKDLILKEFTLITDDRPARYIENASKDMADRQAYGCGCFWFIKR